MLKIVLPNRITNLSEKKLNKFNSHPLQKIYKKTKFRARGNPRNAKD